MRTEPVIIIGGGPAGISAAIELTRQGISPLVFEKDRLGGLLHNANLVENYPGFPDGVSGCELVAMFRHHVDRSNIRVIAEEVTSLDTADGEFVMSTRNGEYRAQIVVVATGTKPNTIGDTDNGVLYDVYPLREAAGKKILIIGAGDAAFDYAIGLAERNEVAIINRGTEHRCVDRLWRRAMEHQSINYVTEAEVASPCRCDGNGAVLEYRKQGKTEVLRGDHIIAAIGRNPDTGFITEQLTRRKSELEKSGHLYFVGDVKNGDNRMTGIAVGDGIHAAMRVAALLQESRL